MKKITEEQVEIEVDAEFSKDPRTLARDITREANTHPDEPEGEKENLDIIKHLLKRMCEIGDVHWNIGLELAGPVEGTKRGSHFTY